MKALNSLVGTGALIRLILRRDRIVLLAWVVGFALLVIGVAAAVPGTYPGAQARQAFASETAGNPTEIMTLGPIFDSSIGGITAWRVRGWGALGIGLAGMLTLIRHTRVEEESGRRELLGSTVVGRDAPLTAALIVILGASLALAALTVAGLIGLGLPLAGSIALGLSIAAAGWLFAQLTQSAGAARGLAGGVLTLFYVMRAVGDAGGPSWVSWVSPFGWTENVQPFAHERWWPFALVLGFVLVLVISAYVLAARRDMGAGLLPERPGRATASSEFRSPLALAWRLHRGTLLAWTVGAAVFGALLGGVAQIASNQINASPQLHSLIARMSNNASPVDGFFALLIYLLGQVIAGYAIQATLRLRSEEVGLRADPVLATPVARLRWASSHLFFAAIGPAIVLAALGLSMGLTYGLSIGSVGNTLPSLLAASLVRLPAVWVLAGIAAALYGLLPRFAAPVTWAVLVVFLLLELAVDMKQVSPSVLNISPFAVTPGLPVAALTVAPLLWLVGISAVLTGSGLFGFRRRDIG
ncbi:MAG TPA: hypothetical protein VF916_12040 [Ktedonobacterales bacterium]